MINYKRLEEVLKKYFSYSRIVKNEMEVLTPQGTQKYFFAMILAYKDTTDYLYLEIKKDRDDVVIIHGGFSKGLEKVVNEMFDGDVNYFCRNGRCYINEVRVNK